MNEYSKILYQNIPSEWKLKQIDKIADKRIERKSIESDIYIGIENIRTGTGNISGYADQRNFSTKQVFYKNDLLYSRIRPYLNKIWLSTLEGYCSTDIIVIKTSGCYPTFLKELILTPEFVNFAIRHSAGTKMPRVNWDDIKKLHVPVPSIAEQRGIVEVLGTVDECIRLTDVVIEKTEELKRGLMQQLLTKGIDHLEYKETHLGEIPKTWEIKRIGDFITLQRGYDLPIQDRVAGRYSVIGSNGVVGHHNEFMVQGPGVIVGRSGTLGRVYYYEGDFWPLNTSLYVKKFTDCDRKFVFYYLQHINLNRFSTGTSVPTLNRNYVHPYKVVIPPFEEQKKIVEILDTQNEKIEKEQEKKKHLNLIKQGIMQLLLSGKIRVELKGDGLHRI